MDDTLPIYLRETDTKYETRHNFRTKYGSVSRINKFSKVVGDNVKKNIVMLNRILWYRQMSDFQKASYRGTDIDMKIVVDRQKKMRNKAVSLFSTGTGTRKQTWYIEKNLSFIPCALLNVFQSSRLTQ